MPDQCQIILAMPVSLGPVWLWLGWTVHTAIFLLVFLHCLGRRKEPASTVLWIFLAWAFPVIGALLYLSFGINRIADKGFRKHLTDQQFLAERKSREDDSLPLSYWRSVHQAVQVEPLNEYERKLNRAMDSFLSEYPLLGGNNIKCLVTGDEFYPVLLESLKKATHHIHLQSFIIANDCTGKEIMDLLSEKASSGVKVRLLYDKFGSARAMFSGFFRKYGEKSENMQIAGWTQVNPLRRQFQINLRNHRKIIVIDGRQAFCGGINIHDENLTRAETPPIRDYHFDVSGPIVQELQYSFMRDWYFMTNEDPETLLCEEYFPHLPSAGSAMIRLANSGPASEMEVIADIFFIAITSAQRQVLLVTPYFVPTPEILRALRTAAMRGVEVRLVLPKQNNHFYAGLASHAVYADLMHAGIRIFERHPPFIHAKALIVDSTIAIVGTANFDARSLSLNYETNLVVYEDDFVNRLKEIVLDDMSRSSEINPAAWNQRPAALKIIENLAYLMMPVL